MRRVEYPQRQARAADPVRSARDAGLRYVCDGSRGIRRVMGPLGFRYIGPRGSVIRNAVELKRIRALAIPPAWTDVWICPDPRGHIQATGRDARGRKQYRYHPRWRTCRDETKFDRMQAFASALPKIRARLASDLAAPGLSRDKVLASVVILLEKTLIRVGNDEYARTNRSFGLTTLRDHHVDIAGSVVRFTFRGKSGKRHQIGVTDRRLAQIVRRCRDLPGQELFQYVDDDGRFRDVTSTDVNAYLKEITGQDFTAKDFRTWFGTVLACTALSSFDHAPSRTVIKKNVLRAIEAVAGVLGNTRAVCRKSYIHPAVLDAYEHGLMGKRGGPRAAQRRSTTALRADEMATLALLRRAARNAAPAKAA
jgi:DNA topoisomerase-1